MAKAAQQAPVQEHESTTSGIMEEAMQLRRCPAARATHFVLCKGSKLRYLIELRRGHIPLRRAIASYGGKLGLLVRLLRFIPYRLLSKTGLGYFAEVQLHPAVEEMVPRGFTWNVLIGTYSNRQKLVFQCFGENLSAPSAYIKVGNSRSEVQMQTEISFLRAPHNFRLISLPKLLGARLRDEKCPFNIMVTEEFTGEKVAAKLTPEIYALYQELSAEPRIIEGREMVRSHGDFAPWNIRRQGKHFMLFDWEFCGWRPRGYDIVHFLTIIGMNLQGKNFSDAFDAALAQVQTYEPDIRLDKESFYREYAELMQF